jgi:hypothetical protein
MPLLIMLVLAVLLYIVINEMLRRIGVLRRPTPASDSQDQTWGKRAQWEYRTNTARYRQQH